MANYCIKHGYPLITREHYLRQNFEKRYTGSDREIVTEINNITLEAYAGLECYGIPDEFFQTLEKEECSFSAMHLKLLTERHSTLENYIEEFLGKSLLSRPGERIDGFIVFSQPIESIRHIAQKYQCPVIAIEISAIRVHANYRQTLFYGNLNGRLFGTNEVATRYKAFISESSNIPVLSRRELIALFCKEESLLLIPLLDAKPKYEIAACGLGIRSAPALSSIAHVTDDDLKKACTDIYSPEDIFYRERPYHSDGLDNVCQNPDPVPTILSSKRVTSIASNILIEAMLWNRVACCPFDIMSFAFACEKDFKSECKADILFLNWFIFGCLVPGYDNVFDPGYWKWRQEAPTEMEIYMRHLSIILEDTSIGMHTLQLPEEERYMAILRSRGLDETFISRTMCTVSDDSIDYNALVSYIYVYTSEKNYTVKCCLNSYEKGLLVSRFELEGVEHIHKIRFKPFIHPTSNSARFESIIAEGAEISECSNLMTPIGFYHFFPEATVRLSNNGLKKVTLTFNWQLRKISIEGFHELIHYNNSLIQCIGERDEVIRERDEVIHERDEVTKERNIVIQERDAVAKERDIGIREKDMVTRERDTAAMERDMVTREKDTVAMERDMVIRERDTATLERDMVIRERDTATLERDMVIKERDTATLERDMVTKERDAALQTVKAYEASTSWKITKPLRAIVRFVRRESYQ
jgi:hypothetical protein